ncbi:MAG: hypothetical protein ACI4F7_08320 [Acutalibacteraceae bacterium]
MKKNWTMRAAVLMLALTIITSCFAGGTFAKYVTAKDGSDTARVAKFGVEITATSGMFNTQYNKDDSTATDIGSLSVESSTTDNVVAPGTTGRMAAFDITGTPEVAVNVAFNVDSISLQKWVLADTTFYCPIKFKVGSTTLSGLNYSTAADFETAITNEVAAYSKNYDPQTDLATIGTDAPNISWTWDFTGATGTVRNQEDVNDTYLGDQAAAANAATIDITVSCTVTQID